MDYLLRAHELLPAVVIAVTISQQKPKTIIELTADFLNLSNCTSSNVGADLTENMLNVFKISVETQRQIERLTVGQHANPTWHLYRVGVITGTMIHDVPSRMASVSRRRANEATHPTELCLISGPQFSGNQNTRYGLANEAKGVEQYSKLMETCHRNFRVEECGLILETDCCIIGASPGRIAYCDCHESWIVEIKCPASMENEPVGAFVRLSYVECESGGLKFKRTHTYFS
jgi:YqaJ-like viral recombinase domain